jgi:hypothetical protein
MEVEVTWETTEVLGLEVLVGMVVVGLSLSSSFYCCFSALRMIVPLQFVKLSPSAK